MCHSVPGFLVPTRAKFFFRIFVLFSKGKNNFSFLEMLDIAGRVIRLMELKHKERTKSVMQPEVSWSANLQQLRYCSRYKESRERGVKGDGGNGHDSRIKSS